MALRSIGWDMDVLFKIFFGVWYIALCVHITGYFLWLDSTISDELITATYKGCSINNWQNSVIPLVFKIPVWQIWNLCFAGSLCAFAENLLRIIRSVVLCDVICSRYSNSFLTLFWHFTASLMLVFTRLRQQTVTVTVDGLTYLSVFILLFVCFSVSFRVETCIRCSVWLNLLVAPSGVLGANHFSPFSSVLSCLQSSVLVQFSIQFCLEPPFFFFQLYLNPAVPISDSSFWLHVKCCLLCRLRCKAFCCLWMMMVVALMMQLLS